MKILVNFVLLLVLVSCGSASVRPKPDSLFKPDKDKKNVTGFLKKIQFGNDTLDLTACEVGVIENGVINSPSVGGPILCLLVIEPFIDGGDVINIASTITVNGGRIPAVILRSVELPSSYWTRVIVHEAVHAKRLPLLTKECRESAECLLDEEVIAYTVQFRLLETYWRELGWTGGGAPQYPQGDQVGLVALNFEKVLWEYHQVGALKDYLRSLGYNQ